MAKRPEGEDGGFLRELHHRVRNNFQIIASLMSLQRRLMPEARRGELRFIEEHVQSIAVAYDVVDDSGGGVILAELVADLVDTLRQIGGLAADQVTLRLSAVDGAIILDQAIELGLYFAGVLPPYLDQAASRAAPVRVSAVREGDILTLTIAGDWADKVELDMLRSRLATAHIRQLRAEPVLDNRLAAHGIRVPLASVAGAAAPPPGKRIRGKT